MPNSYLANPKTTKQVLDSFGLSAKYKYGQNFLVDDNIVGRILQLAKLQQVRRQPAAGHALMNEHTDDASLAPKQPASSQTSMAEHINDATIVPKQPAASQTSMAPLLEIGPGIGTLSLALLKCAPLISVECDQDMVHVLKTTTKDFSNNFAVIQKDALKLCKADIEDASKLLGDAKDGTCAGTLPKKIVANLPYKIAATLILDYFERFDFIEEAVVMVQMEVADRICAKFGTKDYGAYSIKLRMYAKMVDRFDVAPTCFYPAPRVKSSVIYMRRDHASDNRALIAAASKIADAAFVQRRKTIRNSLSTCFAKSLVDEMLAACNIDPSVRGEALNVEDYLRLGEAFLHLQN